MSFLGIDRPIALTIINRGWSFLSGPLTIAFVVAKLSAVEQGFYYTFISVLGLQVFFELGFGFVILQTVSHLMPALSLEDGEIRGSEQAIGRIGTLLADVCRWYAILACLFVVAVLATGFWMFSTTAGQQFVIWRAPWLLVVVIFGASIVTNVMFSFIEGMGFIAEAALGRLLQGIGGGLALWLALALGAKLYALGAMYLAMVLIALGWIGFRHGRRLRRLFASRAIVYRMSWRHEIWPFQWRIATSWISGYLASLAITPIVFRVLGPVPAGQIGLSITIVSAASLGALAWVSTKSAIFGRLVAERKFDELDRLYAAAFRRSIGMAVVAMAIIIVATIIVWSYMPRYANRILPIPAMVALAAATVFNTQISAQAFYLRAFRREPFMQISIVNGLCLAGATVVASRFFGIDAVAYAYAAITGIIAFFWCRPLFYAVSQQFKGGLT